jgi:hypothetical protein
MYDREHILVGREVIVKKQPGWHGLLPLVYVPANVTSATFKLTRDSQGLSRSLADLEDFRTVFRENRDSYLCNSLYLTSELFF